MPRCTKTQRRSGRVAPAVIGPVLVLTLLALASCSRSDDATGPPLSTDDGVLTVAGLLADDPAGTVEVSGRVWVGPDPGAAASTPAVRICQSVIEADVPDVPYLRCDEPAVAVSDWVEETDLEWADPDGTDRSRYSGTVVVTGRLGDAGLDVTAVRDGARVMTEAAPAGE